MDKLLRGVAAALTFVCSGAAAIPDTHIVFDPAGAGLHSSGWNTFSSTQFGITLTATGWQWYVPYRGDIGDNVTLSNQRDIIRDTYGGDQRLGGVDGDSVHHADDDDREAIHYPLTRRVNLIWVPLNTADNDAFDFILSDVFTLDGIGMSSNDFTWTPGNTFNGTSIGFGADDGGLQIREFIVARPAPPPSISRLVPSGMPEPSVMAMFGMAMLLLGLYRKEQKQRG